MFNIQRKINHTNAAFKALNNAVIPQPLDLAQKQGQIQSSDSLKHSIDEYQIWTLNHSLSPTIFNVVLNIYLAKPTAKMLDKAASQLIKNKGNKEPVDTIMLREAGTFAVLAPSDRLRAISLLEQFKISLFSLPFPFFINPGLVFSIIGTSIMLTTIGYYSGWIGYGSTSLETPDKRTVECFPASWKHVGYPGPSKGYHSFRGYLINEFTDRTE